ncbi:MAG: long-chain fatty acid--CoA ligase [Theionarchaea archaeon]|nr:long-chain fatty acid--CoA ligase [Theionarchaea archaeon]MBU7000709.1 long-chain fatty acid--CoA ligase [Theionarchaea archaeon]MBU7021508.1 long-chain fatty acid--CoA ligase [Theionarchaea archaeon]MBU7033552.1 long-chain fatty acid--CoA ligase [Theionarchaea archaeon]MBU7039639.1 long-chain fatty acid--CoA ligase [Theionarchaea archaeon]
MEKIWLKHYPEEVPESADYPDVPMVYFLDEATSNFPEKTSMIFVDKKISYFELYDAVLRLANGLIDLGVEKGDRVSIFMPNCPQAVISYFAIQKAGGIVVETNPLYVERELEYQLQDAGVSTVITLDLKMLYPKVQAIRGTVPLRTVIVSSLSEYLSFPKNILYPVVRRRDCVPVSRGEGTVFFKDLLSTYSRHDPRIVVDPDECAVLLYTGGTTGVPKGVALTHKNLVANCVQGFHWLYKAEYAGEIILAALPLFHSFGHTCCLNFAVYAASTLVLIPDPRDTRDILENIQKHRSTMVPGVPAMYVNMVNYPGLKRYDLSSVKYCFSGAAPMPVEILEQFENLTGGVILEGFGMTETSPVTHINPLTGRRKVGSIGLPISDTDCRIVDLKTGERDVPVGEEGEMVVRGPQVMKGYWNDAEETRKVLREDWMHTGDIARMDEEGYFYIVGRKKDMIISSGFNVYPREIEEVLFEHPQIKEASVIGIPDEKRGESVKAFIVPREGEQPTVEGILAYCKENLAAYKVPTSIEIVKTLPKSMVGKVLRRKLRENQED